MPDDGPLAGIYDDLNRLNIKEEYAFDLQAPLTSTSAYWRPELDTCAQPLLLSLKTGGRTDLLVLGAPGSGKTALIAFLLAEISRTFPTPFQLHTATCRDGSTTHKVLRQYLGTTQGGKRPILDILHRTEALCQTGPHIFLLDEVDLLEDDALFYHLTRRPAFARSSLICLSKTPKFLQNLPSDVRSSYSPRAVYFDTYTPDQLFAILQKRAAIGLHEYNEGLLRFIAAVTAREARGDVRVGLRVTKALCQFRPVPTDADIPHLQERVTASVRDSYQHIRNTLLPGLSTFKLHILSVLPATTPMASRDAYAKYAANKDHQPSYIQFWRACKDLEYLDLVSTQPVRVGRSTQLQIDCLLGDDGQHRLKSLLQDRTT